jgi:DNA-binding SARP family transcriptional activator
MIRFTTLGTVSLADGRHRSLAEVLAQPKRTALLAYLAIARPRGFHRRDTLVGHFWPEMDTGHARHALRQALYVLRQALGEGVILCRGAEEVGLDERRVWCDVRAFDDAADAAHHGAAMDLYGGELLRGFFIPGAPEFDRWLETEREHLRGRAVESAWGLADEHEIVGDAAAAIRVAREACRLAPCDEGALRRLIALRARLGDRAGALRSYREFARELWLEYELEPSDETRDLVRRINATAPSRPAEPALV